MPDWKEINTNLDSPDESLVLKTLEDLVLDDYDIDEETLQVTIPKCIAKLDHHDIKLRSNAVGVIAKQMRSDHTGMVYVVEALGKYTSTFNIVYFHRKSKAAIEYFAQVEMKLSLVVGLGGSFTDSYRKKTYDLSVNSTNIKNRISIEHQVLGGHNM